jgi:hypothetical protein
VAESIEFDNAVMALFVYEEKDEDPQQLLSPSTISTDKTP